MTAILGTYFVKDTQRDLRQVQALLLVIFIVILAKLAVHRSTPRNDKLNNEFEVPLPLFLSAA
jgi:hypothetical protein